MAELTVIYWRDIPAQVIAGKRRNSVKAQLAQRFADAIDSAAMRAGLFNSDDYLGEWRRSEPAPCPDDLDAAVAETVAALDRDYPPARLKALIDNGGKEDGA